MISPDEAKKLMDEAEIRKENDLTLECLLSFSGKPTRDKIVDMLPPLGKATLSYNPDEDNFADFLEKFDTHISIGEFYEFASDLFDCIWQCNMISFGWPDSLSRQIRNNQTLFLMQWYDLFGFASTMYQETIDKIWNNDIKKKKYLNDMAWACISIYGKDVMEWFYEGWKKYTCNLPMFLNDSDHVDEEKKNKMKDYFVNVLPYYTGRLINKLIIKATNEAIKLPYSLSGLSEPIDISYEDQFPIYVYSKACHCIKCERKFGIKTICDVQALVQTVDNRWIPIGIQYCQGCNKGLINEEILDSYNAKYGQLMFERSYSDEEQKVLALKAKNFSKDSVLSRCGYSIGKNITREQRQAILEYIINSKKASKAQIQELITFFIRFHNHPRYKNACDCWKEDLLFVVNYKIDEQPSRGRGVFRHT